MDSRPTTKVLRRSKSFKDNIVSKSKPDTKCTFPFQTSDAAEPRRKLSKSADDILAELQHVTEHEQHGVIVYFNGFYKSETMKALFETEFDQDVNMQLKESVSNKFRGRAHTASLTYNSKRETSSRSRIRKNKSFCESRCSSSNTDFCKDRNSREREKSPVTSRDDESHTNDEAKKSRKMQLKRCKSSHEIQRRQKLHSCDRFAPRTPPALKPSPWAYGGQKMQHNTNNTKRGNTSKALSSSRSAMSCSSSEHCSVDSTDSRASRTTSSFGSINTIGSDCSPRNNAIQTPRTSQKATNQSPRKDSSKHATQSPRNEKPPKPSLIPRPAARSQSAPHDRPMSLSHGPSTDTVHQQPTSKSPRTHGNFLFRSLSAMSHGVSLSGCPVDHLSSAGKRKEASTSMSLDSLDTCSESWSDCSRERQVFVADSEADYPLPSPCHRPKAEVFNPRDFLHIDQHALKSPDNLLGSFDDLLDYLLQDLTSQLARLRAIFRWLVSQEIPLQVQAGEITPDTPLGFLYNIRERRATYPELFATTCRRAQLPCIIIHGVAKSIAYAVGDKVNRKKMKNSWNAVYVDDEWRIVHPYWARQSVRGYTTGCWAVVESDDFHSDDGGSESKQTVMHTANDFFFLTDADKFITKCFPDEPPWQLLDKPLSKHEYEELPFLQPAFYELQLHVKSHQSCVITSENGKVELCIEMPPDKAARYTFKYKLFRHRNPEAEGEYDQVLLDRYLLHFIQGESALFQIRFPISGDYKLELHCYDSKRTLASNWICDYKIVCPEPMTTCEPLPIVPAIGWGPTEVLEKAGIECLTHKVGVVNIDREPTTFLRFAFSANNEFEVEAELLANKLSRTELRDHVTVEQDGDHAVVKVDPPKEGEYALQIFTKNKESERRQNVCNYLMHRTTIVEDPELADIRQRLLEATAAGDLDALTVWIDRFEQQGVEDRGDLTEARRRLHMAKLDRDLREAIARKDLGLLERTMASISDTTLRQTLGPALAGEAEALRIRLRRLKRLQHAVLEMDGKTISELRSYPKPPPAVHGVMTAAFILLGNKEETMQKWSKIQGLISKRGKESLKRRVADFRVDCVPREVLVRVRAILARYDLETVQIASIGAATFYQWACSMVGEGEF